MFRVRDAQGKFKYAGRSKAVVIDNRDPELRGRIQIRHPLLGETAWVDYLRDRGTFDIPSIGDIVFVEADSGMPEFPIAHGIVTRIVEDTPEFNDKFSRDVPTNRGYFSPHGHTIELDDGIATLDPNPALNLPTTEQRGIRITSIAGNKIHILEDAINSQEYILIEDTAGNSIRLDTFNKTIDINAVENYTNSAGKDYTVSAVGNVLIQCDNATINASGNIDANATGNANITAGGDAKVIASNNVEVQCVDATITSSGNTDINATGNANVTAGGDAKLIASGVATVDGATVKLGAAAVESVVKGTSFMAYFNTHIHTDSLSAPTTPPVIPMTPAQLSTKVKTE